MGVRTYPASSTSAFTITTDATTTTTAKATTTNKSSSSAMDCFYCVDPNCLILGIFLTCSSFNIFEFDKFSTEQIVSFIKSLFGNW